MNDGDLCIKGTAGDILGIKTDPAVDGLMAELFGGHAELVLCIDCTERGGGFEVEVYHENQPAE